MSTKFYVIAVWTLLSFLFLSTNESSGKTYIKRIPFGHLFKTQLNRLGIEADLILFHPYDKGRWGFDADMGKFRHPIIKISRRRSMNRT